MKSSPRHGQRVRVHYAASYASFMPFHGQEVVVAISGRGKPRNHLVSIDGRMVAVPCGNLVEVKDL